MRIKLSKHIGTEGYEYYVNQSIEEFRAEIQDYFKGISRRNAWILFEGKYHAEDQFYMYSQASFGQLTILDSSVPNPVASINGKIYKEQNFITKVVFQISPNFLIPLIFLISVAVGIYFMISYLVDPANNSLLYWGLFFMFGLSIILMAISKIIKYWVLSMLVAAFDMKKAK